MAEVDETSTPLKAVKERHSLTLDQRRALRRWANTQTVRPSHKACIDWFRHEYDQTISQSTVSHSLSPKYARLDGDPQLSGSRLRFGNWPDVEKLVLLWYQQVVNSGRHPSNEELGEKAKAIFSQLPRYKDEQPPEFSPGWIHRFKKRYGLLIRRQRRHGSAPNPADDINYLVDAIPRFMSITAETPPSAIRDAVQRVVGVEASLSVCARARDEIMRRMEATQHNPQPQTPHHMPPNHPPHSPNGITPNGADAATAAAAAAAVANMYTDDDPEIVLQNALRALQQEEAAAEAEAAAVREAREHEDRAGAAGSLAPLGAIAGQAYAQVAAGATPAQQQHGKGAAGRFQTPVQQQQQGGATGEDLTLTPIQSAGPVAGGAAAERPVRCPYCVNRRMLQTIKDAVEHMSTHVVV